MKKIKLLLTTLAMLLTVVFANSISLLSAKADNSEPLVYNAAENFSDNGSDFWKYYFINSGEYGEFTPLVVNGTGLFGEYYADGSFGFEYRYCVSPNDFTSNEYHQYLEIWGGVYIHPGFKADAVLSFVAPVDGVINIEAVINAMAAESNGVKIYTSLNNASNIIAIDGENYLIHNQEDTTYRIENLTVNRGDEIFFRINCNDELRFDKTYFSPTITYVSYELPNDVAINISDENLTVQEGGIRFLETSMNINLGTELNYTYKSSDENVVRVLENGLIYALKKGTATITVSVDGTDYAAQCVVNVVSNTTDVEAETDGCNSTMSSNFVVILLGISVAVIMVRWYLQRKDT